MLRAFHLTALLISPIPSASPGTPDATQVLSAPLLPEATNVEQPGVVSLADVRTPLGLDLQVPRRLVGLVLQADGDDVYRVEASLDGRAWNTLWRVPRVEGGSPGLRTRSLKLPVVIAARFLSVRATSGTTPFAVSRLYALETLPTPWPPRLDYRLPGSRVANFPFFAPHVVGALKSTLGLLGALLLCVRLLERRLNLQPAAWYRPAMVALAALAALAWTNVLNFHYVNGYLHAWEVYHYYVGSKYFAEIGYGDLYACSAAAEADDGGSDAVRSRRLRNLATNAIESAGAWADHPEVCRGRFTPERWAAFRHDVGFFREAIGETAWADCQLDHGFNASPVWVMAGGLLARTGPASWTQIRLLCTLDLALLAWLFVALWRGFGLEAACTAALVFGVNGLATFSWTGGAFLRHDWMLLAGLGLVALRAERPVLAGFTLGWSTLLRVFPGFLLVGLGLAALLDARAQRSLRPLGSAARVAAGAALGAALLMPLSLIATGRGSAWRDFWVNTQRFVEVEANNFVGLQVAATHRADLAQELNIDPMRVDPMAEWRLGHQQALRQARPFLLVAQAASILLLALAVRGQPGWVAALLGLGLAPLTFKLANYYYSWLALLGALVSLSPGVGLALVGLAWATHEAAKAWPGYEERAVALSVLVVVFVLGLLTSFARAPRASVASDPPA